MPGLHWVDVDGMTLPELQKYAVEWNVAKVERGRGRIVTLHHRSPALYQIR
jgi:hypothetical protein